MKVISLLSFLVLALSISPASAQTPVTAQMAQQYANDCINQPQVTMDKATITQFCQCTAAQIQQHITLEDIRAQSGNDQAARIALNKTVTQVYAPCIRYPVRALVMRRCANEPQTANNPALCNCSADGLANYTQIEAPRQLLGLFAQNPNITDPSTAFMSTPQFQAAEKQIAENCSKQTAN